MQNNIYEDEVNFWKENDLENPNLAILVISNSSSSKNEIKSFSLVTFWKKNPNFV